MGNKKYVSDFIKALRNDKVNLVNLGELNSLELTYYMYKLYEKDYGKSKNATVGKVAILLNGLKDIMLTDKTYFPLFAKSCRLVNIANNIGIDKLYCNAWEQLVDMTELPGTIAEFRRLDRNNQNSLFNSIFQYNVGLLEIDNAELLDFKKYLYFDEEPVLMYV